MLKPLLLAVALLAALPLHADDGAASIGAGGIILMKREPRITMVKELLHISPTKVIVDYDFRNDSSESITTDVAFPVPAYTFGEDESVFGDSAFKDFKLSIGGQSVQFKIEVRAYVDHRDITELLANEHIDAATFGHWDAKVHDFANPGVDFRRAGGASRQRLDAGGAFKDGEAMWKVEKKYYWSQTFPAHSTIHIRHQYTPVLGGTNSVRYGLEAERLPRTQQSGDDKQTIDEIDSLCLEPPIKKSLLGMSRTDDIIVPFYYVDFILTTANTWKTPIEDFTLIVERPKPDAASARGKLKPIANHTLVSFCWNGPIEKIDDTHFSAHKNNFVPEKELRVGFISVDHVSP